ncbi:MAG: DoxX family protein [Actinobacteria bacterium]|nr:DoxX family protein [Actinomycetota bacterium]
MPLAAFGLAAVMVGAIIWHAPRGEALQMGNNVVVGLVMIYLGYGRWRLAPLT